MIPLLAAEVKLRRIEIAVRIPDDLAERLGLASEIERHALEAGSHLSGAMA